MGMKVHGAKQEGMGEASGEDGAMSVGRSAVSGSEGWAARDGLCAVSPGGEQPGSHCENLFVSGRGCCSGRRVATHR